LVGFRATASLDHCGVGIYKWDWDFGDGTPHSPEANACHAYEAAGDFTWTLKVEVKGRTQLVKGLITIDPQPGSSLRLTIAKSDDVLDISWPVDRIGETVLERTSDPTKPGS
jgi:PKD repeat protein